MVGANTWLGLALVGTSPHVPMPTGAPTLGAQEQMVPTHLVPTHLVPMDKLEPNIPGAQCM